MSSRFTLMAVPGFALIAAALAGCGSASLDLAGYPDKQRDRLYSEGRLGGDKGLADFDLRKAWNSTFN
jgi:hypothetical protein